MFKRLKNACAIIINAIHCEICEDFTFPHKLKDGLCSKCSENLPVYAERRDWTICKPLPL